MSLKNKITIVASLLVLTLTHAAIPTKHLQHDTAIQHKILAYINQYRQEHGLGTLKMHEQILIEAKKHSLDMAQHRIGFGHQYFAERIKTLRSQIKNSSTAAENIAYNYQDAQQVVREWLRSPGHKRNIEGHYNLTGIGIARDEQGKIYFTQIFLRCEN